MPHHCDAHTAFATLLVSALLLLVLPLGAAAVQEPAVETAETAEATETVDSEPTSYELPADVVTVKSEPELKLAPGEKIDLSLRDADLVEVLRSFAVLGDFNLVVQPGVEGKVTVELHDVEWEKALAVILRVHGLSAEVDGNLWAVERRRKH